MMTTIRTLALALLGLPLLAQTETTATPAALRARLPESTTLVERGDELRWELSEGPSLRIVDVEREVATVAVEGARVRVAAAIFRSDAAAALKTLPALVHFATGAGLDLTGLTYGTAPLLGAHLRGEAAMVLPEGVARAVEPADGRTARTRSRAVRDAAHETVAALAGAGLDPDARETLARALEALHLRDVQAPQGDGALSPSFLRLMVRHGWLGQLKLGVDFGAVVESLAVAETHEPARRFAGEGLRMERLADAFGPTAIVLRTPARAGYAVDLAPPQFFDAPRGLVAVVWFAPDQDPLTAATDAITAAEVFLGEVRLASWSRAGGFVADGNAWATALPESVREGRGDLAQGALPPYVVVPGLGGEVRLLAVAAGTLRPPADGSPAEVERFFTDAARVLPDAGHLDLLGEYLFRYTFDSPDPRHPLLVGDQKLNGEIHQTAAQTIGTVLGGIVRGDCDDLAEVYLAILERQGKHGHLMSLPRHCAMCWVEPGAQGQVARVLQTGPPMQFVGDDVARSLSAAYAHFANGEVVDPNQLGILLRFSGENVRTPYVLGWRVYAEPKYSAVMEDVQRDWHFHTYRHGYEKMKALVAAGDDDNANYRELSGLCQATGQFAASAEYLAQAIAHVHEPDARVNLAVERVNDLFESGQRDAGRALVNEILVDLLPAAKEALGPSVPALGQHLAAVILNTRGNADLALRVVQDTMLDETNRRLLACYRYLGARDFDVQEWHGHPMWVQSRDLLQGFSGILLGILDEGGPALAVRARNELQTAESWLAVVAFRAPLEAGDLLDAYAIAARYWKVVLGEARFRAVLAAAEAPTGKPVAEQRRVGYAQLLDDLPWISISTAFWLSELQDLLGRDADGLDAGRVRVVARAALAARDAARLRALHGPRQDTLLTLAELSLALVDQDEVALRALFTRVRELDDKILRDLVTRWLGQTARFWPLPWFQRVLAVWRAEVDFKPSYFGIGWAAVLGKAPAHALAAGRLAAERFGDDEAFRAELAFMQRLLGDK